MVLWVVVGVFLCVTYGNKWSDGENGTPIFADRFSYTYHFLIHALFANRTDPSMRLRPFKLNRRPRRWLFVLLAIGLVGFITRSDDDLFEISKNMEIFGELYKEVNETYVDDTNPTELMRTGIEAMLTSLDPYTNYYSESQIEYAKLLNSGQYSSIGAEVGLRQGRIVVVELYVGGPAAEADLRVGDQILKIDNISVEEEDLSLDEVRSLLLGERGSTLTLKLQRGGETGEMTLTLERGGKEDESEDVPYFGMINEEIGYVLLTAFHGNAAAEVKAAIDSLMQAQPDMQGLVLDLRGNPGGRLDQAVDICNLFVSQGEKIVEMRGRTVDSRNVFYTRSAPWNTEIPIAVIVNGRSASASEIVSGALQDLDRAVVVGRRSFGKGLVQRVKPLTRSPQTQMKITVAKYYTPSGRCIQALDYSHRNPDGSVGRVPDSLVSAFSTRNGRTVYDGGGVQPDLEVEKDDDVPVLLALQEQNLIFDFASQYANQNSSLAPPRAFTVSDSLYQAFVAYTEARNFDFRTATEQQLEDLEAVLASQDHAAELEGELKELHTKLSAQKDQDLYRYQELITHQLREEIIQRFYYKQGVIESSFERDPDILTAMQVLQDTARYQTILAGPTDD